MQLASTSNCTSGWRIANRTMYGDNTKEKLKALSIRPRSRTFLWENRCKGNYFGRRLGTSENCRVSEIRTIISRTPLYLDTSLLNADPGPEKAQYKINSDISCLNYKDNGKDKDCAKVRNFDRPDSPDEKGKNDKCQDRPCIVIDLFGTFVLSLQHQITGLLGCLHSYDEH